MAYSCAPRQDELSPTSTTRPTLEPTPTPVPTFTPSPPPPATATLEPTPIQEIDRWYEDLTQAEMAEIARTSQRLFRATNTGVPEEVPLSRVDEHEFDDERSGLLFTQPTLYGVVVDSPRLELLTVTDYEGNERALDVYIVPLMLQTKGGEFIIKEVTLGAENQTLVGFTRAHFHRLPSSLEGVFSSFSVQEAASRLTANTQHGFQLSIWDNEPQELGVISGNPGDLRILHLMLINRTYGQATLEFINALKTGAGKSALEEPKYLSSIGVITLNVET